MSQRELVAAELVRQGVEDAAAQTRTEGTVGGAGLELLFDDLIALRCFEVISKPMKFEVLFYNILAEAGESGIDINGDQFKADRSLLARRR